MKLVRTGASYDLYLLYQKSFFVIIQNETALVYLIHLLYTAIYTPPPRWTSGESVACMHAYSTSNEQMHYMLSRNMHHFQFMWWGIRAFAYDITA